MSKAQDIYSAAFSKPRDPRSAEYKQGVLDVLRFRLGEAQSVRCAYRAGTAQADAYFSGCDEGHRLATAHLEASADARKNGHKQARHAAAELATAADSEIDRLRELERRVAKRCAEAVQSWAPELRELLTHNA